MTLECEQCLKAFKTVSSLKYHTNSIHLSLVQIVQCDNCNYNAKSKSDIAKHVESMHEKLKRYTCGVFAQVYFGKRKITNHAKMHLKEAKQKVISMSSE